MLTVLVTPSCTSCKKAKNWLNKHRIAFTERNIMHQPLSTDEIKHLLSRLDDGLESLISTRNRFAKNLNVDFDELSFQEAVQIISDNPQILRRPIIMDDKRLHIGYNEEEIRVFLPRSVRQVEMRRVALA
jgi:regulatory protein spx